MAILAALLGLAAKRMMKKRSSTRGIGRGVGVLDAPEERYASEKSGPRRVAGGLRRDLQEDFGSDFEKGFGEAGFGGGSRSGSYDSSSYEGEYDSGFVEESSSARRRVGVRGGVRPGLMGRMLGALPQTLWGRIFAGTTVAVVLGLGAAGAMAVRSALLHDARFVVPSSAAIGIEGNKHVTKAQLLSIFGGDVDRNIFTVSLAERRAELERLPWVEHATVMRLLPDHLRVSIVERTPVAFVRQGAHIGLVDKNGVLMDMVSGAGEGTGEGARYSFPVVTGIAASEPISTRAARMKIFSRFTTELDGDGRNISGGLSEVDLSDPEDVRALIPDGSAEVLVHFGDSDFLDRYDKYKEHLTEWKTQYPRLASVDMRYDRQVVLEMQPGSGVPVPGGGAAGATEPAKAASAVSAPAAVHGLVGAHSASAPAAAAHVAAKPVAKAVPTIAHSPVVAGAGLSAKAPASASTAVPSQGVQVDTDKSMSVRHLTVAKDVTPAKKVAAKPVAKKVVAKKVVKKSVAKKPAAKAAAKPGSGKAGQGHSASKP